MLLMLFVLLIFPIFVVMVSVAIVLVAIVVPARIRVAAVIGSASAVIRPINVVGAVTLVWPAVVGAVTVIWPIVVVFLRWPAPCHAIAGKRRKRSNASCHQHRDGTDQENLPHTKISHIIHFGRIKFPAVFASTMHLERSLIDGPLLLTSPPAPSRARRRAKITCVLKEQCHPILRQG